MADHILLSHISNSSYLKLALARRGERPGDAAQYACDSLDEYTSAVTAFLDAHDRPALFGAAVSAGGWDQGGVMAMPHNNFSIGRDQLREFLGVQRVNLVNDCVARALAIPRLEARESVKICGLDASDDQVMALVSPNMGLGQAALAPDGTGGWMAIPCEGGHSDLVPANEEEWQVWKYLHDKYGSHVSRERAISIQGIVDIWLALNGATSGTPTIDDIISAARADDPRSRRAINMSMAWYAAFASDVALILGARGGVYLAGDLLDMLGDLFDVPAFVARYGNKGRLSDYVKEIPVFRVQARDLEVIGLATLFD